VFSEVRCFAEKKGIEKDAPQPHVLHRAGAGDRKRWLWVGPDVMYAGPDDLTRRGIEEIVGPVFIAAYASPGVGAVR